LFCKRIIEGHLKIAQSRTHSGIGSATSELKTISGEQENTPARGSLSPRKILKIEFEQEVV
jgi:hypothetical protein